MKLTHPSVGDIQRFNWQNILAGVSSLKEFEDALQREWPSYEITLEIDTESISDAERARQQKNKYFGDAFEVFVEMLFLKESVSNTGVSNYRPLNFLEGDKDIGVDGIGIGNNEKPATVQVKFRSDTKYELFAKADGLSGFVAASQNIYNVDINDTMNMVVVTNCAGINQKSKDVMLFGKVNCLGRKQITHLVDGIPSFWTSFREATVPVLPKAGRRPRTSLI